MTPTPPPPSPAAKWEKLRAYANAQRKYHWDYFQEIMGRPESKANKKSANDEMLQWRVYEGIIAMMYRMDTEQGEKNR